MWVYSGYIAICGKNTAPNPKFDSLDGQEAKEGKMKEMMQKKRPAKGRTLYSYRREVGAY